MELYIYLYAQSSQNRIWSDNNFLLIDETRTSDLFLKYIEENKAI